jgi:hypothetical protein
LVAVGVITGVRPYLAARSPAICDAVRFGYFSEVLVSIIRPVRSRPEMAKVPASSAISSTASTRP